MSKSPLSGAFADSSATTKKKNKKNGAILLISGIALATSIGGVFASTAITINSNAGIEFGQGIADTSVCAASVSTAISQEYDGVTAMDFIVNEVTVSDIDVAACSSTTLRVALIGSSGEIDSFTIVNPSTTFYSHDFSSDGHLANTVTKIGVTTE